MKTRILLLALSVLLLTINSIAQIKVTSEKVTYKRTGKDVMDFKKTFEVNYPRFSGADKDVLQRLERTFDYWRVFGTSLEEETENQWLTNLDYTVNYNKNGLLELTLTNSGVGAYPSDYSKTIVAELSSGTQVEFTQVFKNRIGLLTEIDKRQTAEMVEAEAQFKKDGGEGRLFEGDTQERASDWIDEFSVNDYGVTFHYDYGFAHVRKALQPPGRYFFSWKDLKPFLREYSSFNDLVEKAPAAGGIVPIVELRIGGLLGGVQDGKFVNAVAASNEMLFEPFFVRFATANPNLGIPLNGYAMKSKGKLAAEQSDDICPDFRYAEVDTKAEIGVAIGANGKWDPVPHKVEEVPKDNAVYRSVVANFLKTRGLGASPVKIENIFKVDLEGDGADEIVIRATNLSYSENELTADQGGYSFVLVRKIVNGSVKDILLAGDFIDKDFPGAEHKYEISSILDLNGDGTMEIVVYGQYYEGAFSAAFNIVNGEPKAVLETGCGV